MNGLTVKSEPHRGIVNKIITVKMRAVDIETEPPGGRLFDHNHLKMPRTIDAARSLGRFRGEVMDEKLSKLAEVYDFTDEDMFDLFNVIYHMSSIDRKKRNKIINCLYHYQSDIWPNYS